MDEYSEMVFLDECGYTGEDLINPEQPVFVLSSIHIPESKCKELKDRHFPNIKSPELKHSSLSKRKNQQDMVISFIEELATKPEAWHFFFVHKKFALATKMVDIILETLAYYDGIDIYEGGLNITLSNMIYLLAPPLVGKGFISRTLVNFQKMCRLKTKHSYDMFIKEIINRDYPEEIEDIFILIKSAHDKIGHHILDHLPTYPLDISTSCAFEIAAHWSQQLKREYTFCHDKSSSMENILEEWMKLTSPTVAPTIVGHDRRKIEFPIRIAETKIEDSREWSGLQLADVLAGAIARWLRWIINGRKPDDGYANKLSESSIKIFSGNGIWPELKFTPEELGTTGDNAGDAIDFIGNLLKGKSI